MHTYNSVTNTNPIPEGAVLFFMAETPPPTNSLILVTEGPFYDAPKPQILNPKP